jgi:hypothetical protein
MLGIYLPERYLSNYTPHFLRKFAICLITVAWKLAQPGHSVLASLAEELAAWVILQEAKRHLEDETEEEGEDAFAAFIDAYFEEPILSISTTMPLMALRRPRSPSS